MHPRAASALERVHLGRHHRVERAVRRARPAAFSPQTTSGPGFVPT